MTSFAFSAIQTETVTTDSLAMAGCNTGQKKKTTN